MRRLQYVLAAFALAACSSDDARPGRPSTDSGLSGAGAGGSSGSSGSAGSAGQGGDASSDAVSEAGTGGDSSSDGASDAGTDAAPDSSEDAASDDAAGDHDATPDANDTDSGTSSCDGELAWGMGQRLAISTSADDVLGSISADELTIAWRTEPDGKYHYADRANAGQPFGTMQTLGTELGSFAPDRAALSADGLRMTLVRADRRAFVELMRSARGGAFGSPSTGIYAVVNEDVANAPAAELVGDPVLSHDGKQLIYSQFGNGLTKTILLSSRLFVGDTWPVGHALSDDARLAPSGSQRMHPSAMLTTDPLVLFYWDEPATTERAARIDWGTRVIQSVLELGDRQMAAPSSDCGHLYYSATDGADLDLFAASAAVP